MKYFLLVCYESSYTTQYNMTHLFSVPVDIIRKIFYHLDTHTQITLKQSCKYFSMLDILYIDENCGSKLDDEILTRYPNVIELNIDNNFQITNEGLKHLPLLRSLNAHWTKITDDGDINH